MKPVRLIAAAAMLFPSLAMAQPASDWQDGVFDGSPTDLFVGESPKTIAFVHAHADLATGALLYLRPCAVDETDGACHLNQRRFVLDYIAAFFGDHISQQNMVYDLAGDGMPPRQVGFRDLQVGVSPDPVWACAWRIAILTSGGRDTDISDLWSYKTDCDPLPESDYQQAEVFAQKLLTPKIRDLSAHSRIDLTLVDDYPNAP